MITPNHFHCSLEHIRGVAARPLTDQQLLAKHKAFLGFGLSADETSRICKLLNKGSKRRASKFDFEAAGRVFV